LLVLAKLEGLGLVFFFEVTEEAALGGFFSEGFEADFCL